MRLAAVNAKVGGEMADGFDDADPSETAHTYSEKKKCESKGWCAVMNELLGAAVDANCPSSHSSEISCSACQCLLDDSCIIRCLDCGPFVYYCTVCEPIAHQWCLHKAHVWEVS
jgi:hypothetical protein